MCLPSRVKSDVSESMGVMPNKSLERTREG